MLTQLERQYNTPTYHGQRPLDFVGLDTDPPDATQVAALDAFLASATIRDIQVRFAEGSLNSETLVRYYVQRIKTYDAGGYQSVLALNPDALQIARDCDANRQAHHGGMYGIPVLLKDNIATGDQMTTTAGAVALADSHADRDAFLVQRLRNAGAIILGKCNLSEWANFMSFDSSNGFSVLGGQVRNAYGHYDVGGSSSGSGASASAGFATVTIGTETSGSLVSPASQNGCCTLKPSLGLISRDRIIPIIERQDTAGPITRSMTDLAIFLNALAGVDDNDPQTRRTAHLSDLDFTAYLDRDGLQGNRIAITRHESDYKTDDNAILDQAETVMRDAGASVVRIPYLVVEFALWTYFYGMHRGVNAYLQAIGDSRTFADLVAFNEEDLPNRAPFGQGYLHLSALTPLTPEMHKAYQRLHHTNEANARHGVQGVLRGLGVDAIVDVNNYSTYAYAVSGFPAVSVPAGYRDNGEPISITLFSDYLRDPELIAMAYAYEQLNPARKAPRLILPSEHG
ncbi:MAG: amidase family protein [Anaerolineae bacterium]